MRERDGSLAAGRRSGPTLAPRRPGDAQLEAVLESKDPADEIPLAVWWLTVEVLQTTLVVRRVTEGIAPTPRGGLVPLTDRAIALSDRACADLLRSRAGTALGGRAQRQPPATLRATAVRLGLLVVTSRATPAERLLEAHAALRAALRAAGQEHAAQADAPLPVHPQPGRPGAGRR